ncbi:MAG: hypothetical protein GC161_06790 [Planctomycetaceae bacterium]|nr:hypothetical protein [Planctomycetaceae bacterium]
MATGPRIGVTSEYLLTADNIRPGALVIAMGADQRSKVEIHPLIIKALDCVVVDSRSQNMSLAEIARGVQSSVFGPERMDFEIGELIASSALADSVRASPADRIMCKLTGVAAQEIFACQAILDRLGLL